MQANITNQLAEHSFADFALVDRREMIMSICQGKSVLHLGCTNAPYTRDSIAAGTLLHDAIANAAHHVTGLDTDRGGLDLLAERGHRNLIHGSVEDLDEKMTNRTFDVIVAGEIIEHLANPGLFLSGIRRFMNHKTRLLVTTVNAYCGMRFVRYAIRGKGGRQEPVHPDHVSYYSYSTLKLLLARHGMNVENFFFYDLGTEHRPFTPWHIRLVNDACVMVSKQLADGLIAIATITDVEQAGI